MTGNLMEYDLIVIGGGPAGMIAAGRAAESGARVLLLEKNDFLGKKLLITGKGRCNITNEETDTRKFAQAFGKNGKFLFSCLHRLGVSETVKFFESLGVKTRVERGGRVFPQSDKSSDVLKSLIEYLKRNRVAVRTKVKVGKIICQDNRIEKIILPGGEELRARNYAICTGGKSYPSTGSSGDGYEWLRQMGHNIIESKPALVPIIAKEKWINDLEGLSPKNVAISVWQNGKKADSRFGGALFTDNGMSGPIILDMSKKIGELLARGKVGLKIDFKPALDFPALDHRILRDFEKFKGKMFRNSLAALLPRKLIPVIVRLSGINPEKKTGDVSKEERKSLVRLFKEFRLEIDRLAGFDKAIITSGGVDLKEVDPKTMRSKVVENLYLAGEILDLDGPTGGYNLQVCWSTGHALGENLRDELG